MANRNITFGLILLLLRWTGFEVSQLERLKNTDSLRDTLIRIFKFPKKRIKKNFTKISKMKNNNLKRRYMLGNLICYCFEYTKEDIEQDVIKNKKSLIMEKIIAEKKMGGCRCAEKNPKGK